ncbi:MAG: hypothetical protein HEQ20_18770 [Aphanizomenon flos-aquae KM1D3_PB]|uniref:hypothetical protein n=1 Tax=Aphanizomenon flos-aquae TaxID=1176 RepID=UPI00190F96D2|nr:hypothetical protein [Aphanizomenon flos-aquae]QSV69387.1 MAG: hypothetical protein HEQ20_18770 [Aphanizomenon flos-aquae KM1D3_PB]
MKIVVLGRQEALMQEARVKKLWAILLFFTHFGFIVFTYLEKYLFVTAYRNLV